MGLPPARSREGSDGLRILADLADIDDRVFFALGHSLTVVEAKATHELMLWRELLDGLESSPPGADPTCIRGHIGIASFEVRIPRGTPAHTAWLDRGLGHAAANNTTGMAGA